MLPPSVRVVVSSASHTSLFPVHSIACHAPKAGASATLSLCRQPGSLHQRRFSSSKPSSPKNRQNGPKTLPARDVTASTSESGSSGGKGAAEKRKRKSKTGDAGSNPFSALPSVPNTQHLSQEALGLTNFFSMHRPISITHSVPKTISDEAFAEIFSHKTRSNKPNEIISTLSRVVDDLEGPMAKLNITKDATEQAREGTQKVDIRHDDGSGSSMFVLSKSMGQFLPFQPPPLPQPESGETEVTNTATNPDQPLDLAPQHRVYQAMFTIEETMDADGQVHVMAHSPKVLDDGATPRHSRRLKYEDAIRRRHELYAISVKKRRKLKMKKQKFKKKLKASRKLRERLHKI